MGIKEKTISNAFWNATGFILPLFLFLITTPYYVQKLGLTQYGIFSLVLLVVGYFSIFDFGFSAATLKYFSEHIGKNDSKKVVEILKNSLFIYLILGILGTLAILVSLDFIVDNLFKIEKEYAEVSKFAFYIAALSFPFRMLITVFDALIKAFQRYDLITKIGLIFSTANLGGGVFILYMGKGLNLIIVWYFLLIILQFPVFLIICRRLFPQFRIRFELKKDILKMLFNFTWPTFISNASGLLLFQLDKALIGGILGPTAVTLYAIPANLSIRIHSFIAGFSQSIFPLSSELKAKEDTPRLTYLYFKSSKIVIMVVTSIAVPLLALSEKIITLWLGADFASKTRLVFPLLIASYYIVVFTIIPYYFMCGFNRPKINAVYSLMSFILNIIACLILIPTYGINGAAIASLVGMLQVPFYIWTFHQISGFHMLQLLKIIAKSWFIGAMQFVIIKYLLSSLIGGKISLLLVLGGGGIILYILYIIFKFYDDDDKQLVLSYFRYLIRSKDRRVI